MVVACPRSGVKHQNGTRTEASFCRTWTGVSAMGAEGAAQAYFFTEGLVSAFPPDGKSGMTSLGYQ